MSGYDDASKCQYCGDYNDPLQLCGCPRAVAKHIRSRTTMYFVADSLDKAANEINTLRAQLASAQAEKAELVKQSADILDEWVKTSKFYGFTGDAEQFELIKSQILALIPKDNQEVNK